jgi:hypothetical protein
MSIPNVAITVADNGVNTSIELPQSNVQVVLGCAVGGVPLQPFATTLASRVQSQFVGGPLVEAAGLVCSAGGVAICVGLPVATHGTATAVVFTGTGTSVVTTTLDGTFGASDDFYIQLNIPKGGTIGVAGIQVQVSLDAGRSFGPLINLGTAATYTIPGTGVTLNFAAGTLVTGDYLRLSTTAPAWNDAGLNAAIAALLASPFAQAGWGSMHVVGVTAAADVTDLETQLDSATASYIYTRAITSARDALAPTAWGGAGETEATWMTAIETAFSASSARRVVVSAGFYNIPSAYANVAAGLPRYRRSGAWAAAVRRVAVPAQRTTWQVLAGSLSNITVDPSNDPADGFIYHDERQVPGLDAARFMTYRTWPKKQGVFVCKDNLMAPAGSQYKILPLGNVVDVTCDIAYATGVEIVGDDLRLNENGTLNVTDALTLQNGIWNAINADMVAAGMISSAVVAVSLSQNVGSTGNIVISITIVPKGYANSITITIGLAVPNAAPTA